MVHEIVSRASVETSHHIREKHVLVVAGTTSRQQELERLLERLGCRVTTADFLQIESLPLEGKTFHLIVADLDTMTLPLGNALARIEPHRLIVLIPEALRERELVNVTAGRYLLTPVHPEELLQAVRDRLELVSLQEMAARLSAEVRAQYQIGNIIGISRGAEMRRTFVQTFAGVSHPIFLSGERGVGKEWIARAVHASGPWAMAPFLLLNTEKLPASTLSGLLFGELEGGPEPMHSISGIASFMGAGTIYISEVAFLPLPLQYRVAALIRDQQRMHESESPSGLRFIFGSHAAPELLRRKGMLVEDLYELVREAHLAIEPLRARVEDIPYFVDHFLEQICQKQKREKRVLAQEALEALMRYAWPENVDELKRVLEEAVRRTSPLPIDVTQLPPPIGSSAPRVPRIPFPEEGLDFYEVVEEFERGLIQEAFRRTGGNQRRAARLLRLKETTLAAMRRRLGVKADRP